ncbi:hypothetical protein DFQ28_000422 [Apophysomyces sp. BC1034]|nr:hypothetical protein DFQ30_000849 [Apophysomyces sp. BC1015]KAG0167786.1 hypothetical protein DFQ29_000271 [Apophysomyces sp. BC1021]KAG0183942.1 hypothetical protein DFQ28_000422 [Apophysomyces sp. BC1034]
MTDTVHKKRKWDDQGHTRSGSSSPATKFSKVSDDDHSKSSSGGDSKDVDPSKAASLAAAKINAMLAQKGISLKDDEQPNYPREKGDGEYIKDIPINDLKNRYMLTRGATQTQIQRETGADVTTRGKYYPDKNLATEKEPPLYLHITASTKEALDQAVTKVEELIETATVPLPGTGYGPREGERRESDKQQRKFFESKIFVSIEGSTHFNIRAKIVGPQGAYVKHIQNETGSRVQLKGKGSGFYESSTGVEADEPLHVHISCPREDGLEKAVKLTQDLIDTVKAEHERAAQYGGSYGRGGYSRNYRDYSQQHPGGYGYPPQNPPPPPGPPPSDGSAAPPPPPDGSQPSAAAGTAAETAYGSGYADPASSAASAAADSQAYSGYDYSQYYAYYGQQYAYDPNYYYNYGYAAPPAPTNQPTEATSQAPPAPEASVSPNTSTSGTSYNAVPPPPQL